jgi:hypothetical protein
MVSGYCVRGACCLSDGYDARRIPNRGHEVRNVPPARKRPGDVVYLYYGARLPFSFYNRDCGFRDNDYKVGLCHRGDNRGYFKELDMFRGSPAFGLC